jgi:hypothetical protein
MFEELQAGLGPVWRLNRPGVGVDHVVVVQCRRGPAVPLRRADPGAGAALPCNDAHAAPYRGLRARLPHLRSARTAGPRLLRFVGARGPLSQRPDRFRLLVVPDDSPRPISAKLLDRPDLVRALRASFRRPAGLHRTLERDAA